MKRSLVFLTLVALCAGCAPALKDLKPALATADSGNLSFAAAGSLVRNADGSSFVMADPVFILATCSFLLDQDLFQRLSWHMVARD